MRMHRTLLLMAALAGMLLCSTANATLVSSWNFDEGAGTTAGDCVDSNPGTLTGTGGYTPAWTTPGVFDDALLFSSNVTNGSYIQVADATNLKPASMSWSLWVNTSTTLGFVGLIQKWAANNSPASGYILEINGSGQARFYTNNGSGTYGIATGTTDIRDGAWHHLVGTYTAGRLEIYVDENMNFTTTNVRAPTGTSPVYIGGKMTKCNFLQGTMDDVAMWNNVLSAGSVAALHDFGLSSTYHYDAKTADQFFVSFAGDKSDVIVGSTTWKYGTGLGTALGLSGDILVLDLAEGGSGFQVIPEPSMLALLAAGLFGLLAYAWRKRK